MSTRTPHKRYCETLLMFRPRPHAGCEQVSHPRLRDKALSCWGRRTSVSLRTVKIRGFNFAKLYFGVKDYDSAKR
ncbi:hypothetical protein V5799_015946, partial [Amblyomma americanum]